MQLREVHRRLEPGLARIAEQLLGHLHVTHALRLRGIEERVDRGDRVVVGDVGLALEEGVDQRLAVDTECDCLAHPLVGEVALTAVHPDLTVRCTADRLDDDVAVVEQGVATDHGELRDCIGCAALQAGDLRGEVVAEAVLQLVEVRLATPPIRVGLEGRAGGRVVLGELECTGACRALVERGAEHEVLRA